MNAGWQVGDLALCVDDGPPNLDFVRCVAGNYYTVRNVVCNGAGLVFNEIENPCAVGYKQDRFRKIKPDTEPCEEEFTVLIKRGRKVST